MAATSTNLCGNCVLVGSQLLPRLYEGRKDDSHTNYYIYRVLTDSLLGGDVVSVTLVLNGPVTPVLLAAAT